MSAKILFVDDEPNVLAGYQRQLRKNYEIDTALSGSEALETIKEKGPYAVIVSDMRMPSMSGVEFLGKVRTVAPHSTRMMLTGNADQQTAMDAVNEGHIFRFLTKPCPTEVLESTLEAGVAQYRLVTAEAELLNKTLLGSVGVLTEILGIVDPVAYEHARTLRKYARDVADVTNYRDKWQLELAALLSPIGRMTLPSELILNSHRKDSLSDTEQEVLVRVPEIGHNLLVKIPRMEAVAKIIFYHTKLFKGTGVPNDNVAGKDIPLGARILKILTDLIDLEAEGTLKSVALRILSTRAGWYDTDLLAAITLHFNPPLPAIVLKGRSETVRKRLENGGLDSDDVANTRDKIACVEINFADLAEGDLLVSNITDGEGALLLSAGQVVTQVLIERLKYFVSMKGVTEPIRVAVTKEDME